MNARPPSRSLVLTSLLGLTLVVGCGGSSSRAGDDEGPSKTPHEGGKDSNSTHPDDGTGEESIPARPTAGTECADRVAGANRVSRNVCADVTYDSSNRAPAGDFSPIACDPSGALGRCEVFFFNECVVWNDWVFPSDGAAGRTVAEAGRWCDDLDDSMKDATTTWYPRKR